MEKRKNYLVYDGEEETVESGSLREMLESETVQEPKTPTEPEKTIPKAAKTDKRKSKKLIEKILIGVIAIVSVAIIGILALFVTGGPTNIVITGQQSERELFAYTAEYSQKINGYFDEVRLMLIDYRDNGNGDIKATLSEIKIRISTDTAYFMNYQDDYEKFKGTYVFNTYTERLVNASKLIDELLLATDPTSAIDINNARVANEKDLGNTAMVHIKQWVEDMGLKFKTVDGKIVLE